MFSVLYGFCCGCNVWHTLLKRSWKRVVECFLMSHPLLGAARGLWLNPRTPPAQGEL